MGRRSIFAIASAVFVVSAHAQEGLMLHQGAQFSLYASDNCKRVQRKKIDLMLECRFWGNQAMLVLKEFPDTRPPPVAERNQDPDLAQRWARNALDGIDPELGSRVRL